MKSVLTIAAALVCAISAAFADNWQSKYPTVRFGVTMGENEKDTIARYAPLQAWLEERLGVKVEIATASSYDGIIQAIAADQIEFAYFGSSAYAAAWTETNGGVAPLLTKARADGSSGYFSLIVTRCDSGITSVDGLEGKVLAFSDPDSTSGYAVPYFNLVKEGYDPETFFRTITFAGNFDAALQGVAQGTFDGASAWANSPENNAMSRMVSRGMLREGEICQIWRSPEITGGPVAARTNLPAGMADDIKQALLDINEQAPDVWAALEGDSSEYIGWIEADHDRYQWVVDMREWLRAQRRSRG